MNTEKITGILKQDIRCIRGDFFKGETVYLKELQLGGYDVASMDGLRVGYAASHEVAVLHDGTSAVLGACRDE